MFISLLRSFFFAGIVLLGSLAWAEEPEQNLPVEIEANSLSVDDAKQIQILEGNAILRRGNMEIKAEKIVVKQDKQGYQQGEATSKEGSPVKFKRKSSDSGELIQGEADRMVHHAKTDQTEMFGNAWVKSDTDEVRGDYIKYDGLNEKYFAKGGPQEESGRVTAVIKPDSDQ